MNSTTETYLRVEPSLPTAQRLIARLDTIQRQWDVAHAQLSARVEMLQNLQSQRTNVQTIIDTDAVPTLFLTAPSPIDETPQRLIGRLTLLIEAELARVRAHRVELERIVGTALAALRRDAIARAQAAMESWDADAAAADSTLFCGAVPHVVEVAGWIDEIADMYEREVGTVGALVDGIRVGDEVGVAEAMRRIGERRHIDMGFENDVADRMKEMKRLAASFSR